MQALSWPDRIRRLGVVAPWLVPAYYLFVKGGFRDGWAGLDYAAQRALAELVLAIKLIERDKLSPAEASRSDHDGCERALLRDGPSIPGGA